MAFIIPANYPLVGLGLGGLMALNVFQSMKVMGARKTADVPYPNMYATAEEAKADIKKLKFNCTQRAHQNTLENTPFIIAFCLYFGLFHPKLSTVFTLLYAVGRINYTTGYATGDPQGRLGGIAKIQYIGVIGLFFGTLGYGAKAALALL